MDARRDGKRVRYGSAGDRVPDAIGNLRLLAEAHPYAAGDLVTCHLRSHDALEPVPGSRPR